MSASNFPLVPIIGALTLILSACGKSKPEPQPSIEDQVSGICNSAAINKFTPGGVFIPGKWNIEKRDNQLIASSVASGQNYAGAMFKSPIKCVVTQKPDGILEVSDVDFDKGGTFNFDKVKNPTPELQFHNEVTGKK